VVVGLYRSEPAEIREMDRLAPARAFGDGEPVDSQSQPVSALFIFKERRVRVFRVTEEETTLTMAFFHRSLVVHDLVAVYDEPVHLVARVCDRGKIFNTRAVEHYNYSDHALPPNSSGSH
jgi:hypothetical protein